MKNVLKAIAVVLVGITCCSLFFAATKPRPATTSTSLDDQQLKAAWATVVQEMKSNAEAWEASCKEDNSVSAEDIQKCKLYAAHIAKVYSYHMEHYLTDEQNAQLGFIIGVYSNTTDIMQKYGLVKSIDTLIPVFSGSSLELHNERANEAVMEQMDNKEEVMQAVFWYMVTIADSPSTHYEATVVVCDYIMYYMAEILLNKL